MDLGEKIRVLREAEGLSRAALSELVGMSAATLKNYERGARKDFSVNELQKITTHPRFMKYTLWLMTGTTAPEAGQISPEVEDVRKRDTG